MMGRFISLWRQDWPWGALATLLMLFLWYVLPPQTLERIGYDYAVRWLSQSSQTKTTNYIEIITIDDKSIAQLGRWPWPGDVHAQAITALAQARSVGYTLLLEDMQEAAGLRELKKLKGYYDNILQQYTSEKESTLYKSLTPLGDLLTQEIAKLDSRTRLLLEITQAHNVLLPFHLILGGAKANPTPIPAEIIPLLLDNAAIPQKDSGWLMDSRDAILPASDLISRSAGLGYLNILPDHDGVIRGIPLVIRQNQTWMPSLLLSLAARAANVPLREIKIYPGSYLILGNKKIPIDHRGFFYPVFAQNEQGRSTLPTHSFLDLYQGKVPPQWTGKTVLVGVTATFLSTRYQTALGQEFPLVTLLGESLSSLLQENTLTLPTWPHWIILLLVVLVTGYLTRLLPLLHGYTAFTSSLLILITLFFSTLFLLIHQAVWISCAAAMILLIGGHLLIAIKRMVIAKTTEREEFSPLSSVESDYLLGISCQQKGDLDTAFEKFCQCTINRQLLESLYQLALEYERQQKLHRARDVYQYIQHHHGEFRDVTARLRRMSASDHTVVLGTEGTLAAPATLFLEGGEVEKPKLGRYEIEKELGKGSMGIVYMGRDPKIDRIVAIKTMSLSQEFDSDDLDEIKERFFREAQTAGRLNHPNIVAIYDAGEELDLAYIAMEYLKGNDLSAFTKTNNLLPIHVVFEIGIMIALTLDYAHRQNVVHRDIKPSNVMYESETGKLKITDFGIARITDSSKTRAGMVLGTPSYMSPEQLSGQKVDGRSDLFSLGVMLFQLATGQLPFVGNSMADLLLKITHEPHPNPLELRPELPPCFKNIIDTSLCKEVEQRYQNGSTLALDLKRCAQAFFLKRKSREL